MSNVTPEEQREQLVLQGARIVDPSRVGISTAAEGADS